MDSVSKWLLPDAKKDSFIATLTPHLAILRTQADVSQEGIANLIGVSRQRYKQMWMPILCHISNRVMKTKTLSLIRNGKKNADKGRNIGRQSNTHEASSTTTTEQAHTSNLPCIPCLEK